jgi:hypothetical protein
MNKYLSGAATFNENPKVRAQNFMQSGHAQEIFNEKLSKRGQGSRSTSYNPKSAVSHGRS